VAKGKEKENDRKLLKTDFRLGDGGDDFITSTPPSLCVQQIAQLPRNIKWIENRLLRMIEQLGWHDDFPQNWVKASKGASSAGESEENAQSSMMKLAPDPATILADIMDIFQAFVQQERENTAIIAEAILSLNLSLKIHEAGLISTESKGNLAEKLMKLLEDDAAGDERTGSLTKGDADIETLTETLFSLAPPPAMQILKERLHSKRLRPGRKPKHGADQKFARMADELFDSGWSRDRIVEFLARAIIAADPEVSTEKAARERVREKILPYRLSR
jgi:hypothetical protein